MISFVELIYVSITPAAVEVTHSFMKDLLYASLVNAVDIEIWDAFALGEYNDKKQTQK